ncbi:hypothetical protein F0562_017028, partial [Nyssa sinensis]
HRFYGKSIPFGGDKDVAYKNASTRGYLSSTQALADYATLIIDLKKNLSATDSPVVVFGGSYGGMLAAWFRLKYPHVAIGALASSAPILNFENIISPYSFNSIITQDFWSESENCYKVIKGSWQQIEDTANQPKGLEILQKSFRICKNYISADSLESWLYTAYVYTAMTDYPTPSNFLNPLPAYPMCKAIDNPTVGNDTFAKLYGAANIYYNYSGNATCFDLAYESDPHGLGGWTWQACTEMIMPTSGNNEDSIFPASEWSYNNRVRYCKQAFNIEPRPNWITTEFGGHDIDKVLKRFGSNIIFFNGLRDPWSGGGVLKNISNSIVAIVAKEGAHHVDLRFSTSEDPEWLRDVRRREHRFYEKSIPFGGDKDVMNASTLGYLSSTQALADYATLIVDLKKNLSAIDSPVVVFGGSYGGMLSAWFRLKYPHVAIGALASSAPILYFENITSPYSFNNIITQDFRSESENCYKMIKGSWQQIEDTANQPGGLEILLKSFKICRNYISADSLESWLYTAYVYTAMTDYPTPSNFLSPLPAYPVKQMCKAIDNPTVGNDTFAKLYGAANIYYNYSGNATCFDLADESDPHGLGGWTWQACTEMIMPTSGNNEDSIFPASEWSYNNRVRFCKQAFNIEPRPNWITTEFGGHDIERVLKRFGSNIIFFNGLRDPWSGGGFPSGIIRPEQPSLSTQNKLYKTKYFTQVLDHFNYHPNSYQTFQQRYLINDSYWGGAKKNAPIFVYMGNEGDIEWFTQNTGFMFETAPIFKALLVFIEHRFYGKSIPFGGDKDVAYKNASTRGYLSSTQALADYATLIIDLKKNLSATDSPVVVFGGSYGGMLAAWFRLKYPHVAIGALASSAPILNFENIISPYSFNSIITQDFWSESENCYKVIKGSWQQIGDTANQPKGLEILQKSFRICKNYISADSLESWLDTAYVYTAMTDYPTPSNFLSPLPAYPVKQMCKAIDNPTVGNDTFAKLYGAANIYYNYSGNATCFDLADESDPHGLGGWTWQACTEMIMPTSGNNEDSIFPASEWSYNDTVCYCKQAFNIEPRPNWITTEFGGHDIERVLKRVLKNISNSIVAIVAKEGAHHVDLRFSTGEDPEWLRDVRRTEIAPTFPSSIIRPEQLSLSTENELYKTKYFTQILDHFNYHPQSYQTFQQKYLINDTYWGGAKKNAPIFVYMGGEADVEFITQNTGFLFDTAPIFKALVVFIEHRFYGKSIPFGGDKDVMNASTLGYLNSTQALADYAALIIDLKKNLSATDYPVVMCKAIDNPTTGNDTFVKLHGAANVYYNYSGDVTCFDLIDASDPHGLGGWIWQDIERVLKRFGSNIIFFNGLRDPWSGGGYGCWFMTGAHHVDLRFSTSEDPEWLRDVRRREIAPTFPSSIIRPEQLISLSTEIELYQTKYFTQILDHFNYHPQSYQTFQQRYLINDTYWGGAKKNAPIFIYMGNEGDIEWFTQNTGFMFETAPHFNALLVFIEHRFYGKSIPFGGDKDVMNASTLGYLSSTQALADYATLIIDLKKNLSAIDSPVVVFGGSYGGMLAAWFRLKYPHVTIGALASSAPILYFDNITSQYSFYNTITHDFRSESENCYKVIKGSWQQIEDTANQPGGLEILRNSFRICKNYIDADSLENWLSTAYIYTAMTDYPTPSNFLNPMPAYPVKQMCKAIDDPTAGNDTFAKLYGAANIYYNFTGTASCFDLADGSDPHGLDGWTWQVCTEMVMPTDGNDAESIFPASEWNYTDLVNFCKDDFDVEPRPNWITTEFGGHDIARVLKLFGAHHVDLRFSTNEDPEWLRHVRRREVKIITKWISQYYKSLARPSQ